MKANKYIFCVNNNFAIVSAFSKDDAFMQARIMGYKGEKKDIRIY